MFSDTSFKQFLALMGIVLIALVVGIFITLLLQSSKSIGIFGFNFLIETTWDPTLEKIFGVLPFLIGTLITTAIAMMFAAPLSLAISIFLGEMHRGTKFSGILNALVELIAGIPSVILGFWGVIFLSPIIDKALAQIVNANIDVVSWPLLGLSNYSGISTFTASLVLAFMIIPFSASLGREVISLVPEDIKEAAYSLGATRYEVIKMVIIPYAKSGIFAGFLLAIGRAMGETMAITMLIGNRNAIPQGIFAPGQTMASLIANEFAEAADELYTSALMEVALILFIMTGMINFIGRFIIKKLSVH